MICFDLVVAFQNLHIHLKQRGKTLIGLIHISHITNNRFWPNECSYWWRMLCLLPVWCDFCLRYWICEILLLEWIHVLFMRHVIWFKELQNRMWFLSGSMCHIGFVLWCCILTGCLCLWWHFYWGFSGGTTVPPIVTSVGERQGPWGTEGALLAGRLESFGWLCDCECGSWNFLSSHMCGRGSLILGRYVHQ